MPRKKELDTSAFGWTAPKELDVLPVRQPVKQQSELKANLKWALMVSDMILRGVGIIALIFTALTWILYGGQ